MKEKVKICIRKMDYFILISMSILIGIGLFCEQRAFLLSEEKDILFIKQLAGIVIGCVVILGILLIDYHMICSLSIVLYLLMLALLGFTLLFGTNLNNVHRWIVIFGIQFQPSEITKVVLIIFLAFLCNYYKNKLNKLSVFFVLSAVVAVPIVLILLEPHLSSALSILFIFCIIVYSAGISYKVIGTALALMLPVVAGILISVSLFNVKLPFIKDYHVNRILFFMSEDESDELSGDFQQNQSIAAIGFGGLHGKMITPEEDEERSYSNIYAKESDFVFAIVGEEFGFIGSFFVIMLYVIIMIRCLKISIRAADDMGKIICMGVSAYMIFQIFINIGVATKVLPNTGLPLPFISYGLTSLISSMMAMGLVLNVGIRQKEK